MRIGKTSVYGLFAVIYVARSEVQKPVQGRDIADAYGIPVEYLLKILQALARGGILKSARGRSGGFVLNRAAESITLKEIIDILESSADFSSLLEQSIPGHQKLKRFLKERYDDVVNSVHDSLHQVSVKQLLEID